MMQNGVWYHHDVLGLCIIQERVRHVVLVIMVVSADGAGDSGPAVLDVSAMNGSSIVKPHTDPAIVSTDSDILLPQLGEK